MDFAQLRQQMVEGQLIARGISDSRVIAALRKVERQLFVAPELGKNAYSDYPLPTREGQTISQPYIVALMSECLRLTGSEKVLEVGTGSGYQTAILAELAGKVYTIERSKNLAACAKERLGQLGYENIFFKNADGSAGWAEEAPFERILITAACSKIPLPLAAQLAEGGLMVFPLGAEPAQTLSVAEKKSGCLITRGICGCCFVPLVGKHA